MASTYLPLSDDSKLKFDWGWELTNMFLKVW